jgi:hypothetical protein
VVGQGHLLVTVTLTNKGNVTVDSLQISALGTRLGEIHLSSTPNPVIRFATGASAAVTLTFPITGALLHVARAPLKVTGTYSAGILSGDWLLPVHTIELPCADERCRPTK